VVRPLRWAAKRRRNRRTPKRAKRPPRRKTAAKGRRRKAAASRRTPKRAGTPAKERGRRPTSQERRRAAARQRLPHDAGRLPIIEKTGATQSVAPGERNTLPKVWNLREGKAMEPSGGIRWTQERPMVRPHAERRDEQDKAATWSRSGESSCGDRSGRAGEWGTASRGGSGSRGTSGSRGRGPSSCRRQCRTCP